MPVDFSKFSPVQIVNYRSKEKYKLISAAVVPATDKNLSSIVDICNETEIYKWLFSRDVYDKKRAAGFLEWAKLGWAHGTHFVFLILDQGEAIAAAMDIKSNKVDGAEVGYWVSDKHSGLATNSLLELRRVAADAGYRCLFARVNPLNARSAGVLKRAGFNIDTKFKMNTEYDAYSLRLETP